MKISNLTSSWKELVLLSDSIQHAWSLCSLACAVVFRCVYFPGGRGDTRSENLWVGATGHWKLDPKRYWGENGIWGQKDVIREQLVPKKIVLMRKSIPKRLFSIIQKGGSKWQHICITQNRGSTLPGAWLQLNAKHDLRVAGCFGFFFSVSNMLHKNDERF